MGFWWVCRKENLRSLFIFPISEGIAPEMTFRPSPNVSAIDRSNRKYWLVRRMSRSTYRLFKRTTLFHLLSSLMLASSVGKLPPTRFRVNTRRPSLVSFPKLEGIAPAIVLSFRNSRSIMDKVRECNNVQQT